MRSKFEAESTFVFKISLTCSLSSAQTVPLNWLCLAGLMLVMILETFLFPAEESIFDWRREAIMALLTPGSLPPPPF